MDKANLTKLIAKLESTERNFLIGKDQRTLELANNESDDRQFEKLRKLFSAVRQSDEEQLEKPAARKKRAARTTDK
jgi:hypothetical protein